MEIKGKTVFIKCKSRIVVTGDKAILSRTLTVKRSHKFLKNLHKLKQKVRQGVSELMSVESVEYLVGLVLTFVETSDEAENLIGDGHNALTI